MPQETRVRRRAFRLERQCRSEGRHWRGRAAVPAQGELPGARNPARTRAQRAVPLLEEVLVEKVLEITLQL